MDAQLDHSFHTQCIVIMDAQLDHAFHTQCIVKANRLHLLAAAQDIWGRVVKLQQTSATDRMGQEEAKVLESLHHPNVVSFYLAQTVQIAGFDVHLTEMDRLCSCARFHVVKRLGY